MIDGDPPDAGPRSRRTRIVGIAVAVGLLAALGAAGWWWQHRSAPGAARQARHGTAPAAGADVPIPSPDLLTSDPAVLRKVTPEQAMAINATMPFAPGANPAAAPLFIAAGDAQVWRRSLECMTAAIYYEAAMEPADGQRAVAQVILNRVRHPIYPKTVCGVVFQGHERTTGCQFSFTCDGALRRRPAPVLWERARRIAAAALAGSVYAPVGWATNYHADYVAPAWAPTLLKTSAIGAHIFYRLPGRAGQPAAFTGHYLAAEDAALAMLALGEDQAAVAADATPGVATLAERPVLDNQPAPAAGTASAPAATPAALPAPRSAPRERWIIGPDQSPSAGAP